MTNNTTTTHEIHIKTLTDGAIAKLIVRTWIEEAHKTHGTPIEGSATVYRETLLKIGDQQEESVLHIDGQLPPNMIKGDITHFCGDFGKRLVVGLTAQQAKDLDAQVDAIVESAQTDETRAYAAKCAEAEERYMDHLHERETLRQRMASE